MTLCYDSGGFMKKIILALLLVLALVTTSEGQRRISGVQRGGPSGAGDPLRTPTGGGSGSSPASGPAPGTLLLGNNNTTTSPTQFTGNQNTAYMMCHTGQATATATTAYFYDSGGYETDPVHVCVWNTSGTLLDCSDNIVTTASPGWRNAAISVSITQDTSYVIGMVCSGAPGCFTNYDDSSPALPQMSADTEGVTFGSEGSVTISDCNSPSGSFTIYITN